MTDSCAVPDHPVMSRLWSERKPIGTLVDRPDARPPTATTRQAASQLQLYRETRNMARLLRNRVARPAQASLTASRLAHAPGRGRCGG